MALKRTEPESRPDSWRKNTKFYNDTEKLQFIWLDYVKSTKIDMGTNDQYISNQFHVTPKLFLLDENQPEAAEKTGSQSKNWWFFFFYLMV